MCILLEERDLRLETADRGPVRAGRDVDLRDAGSRDPLEIVPDLERVGLDVVGVGVVDRRADRVVAPGARRVPAVMITARAIQGVGAAMLAPSTLALLSTSFPEGDQRTRAMAAYGALAGIATSIA